MTEWKEYKLGEIVHIIGGGTPKTSEPKYWNGSIPWLSVVDFNNGNKYVYDAEKYITQEGLENSSTRLLKKGDIIISARGTVGAMAMIGREMAFNQSCYGIRNSELVDNHYLFYLLKNSINELKQNSHGGVFDTITRETFNMIEISLPPLTEQIHIASILSSLDDKIDLLHRENKTLEAMAETLFRQWFIEEAKEDWEEKPLSFYGKIVCGKTPPKKESKYFGGETPFIKIPDMHNKTFVINSEDSLTKEGVLYQKEKILPPFSIIVSCIATVGLVVLNAKEAQTNQQINSIIPYEEEYRYFLYLHLMNMYDDLNAMASGGTATLNLNTSNFSKIKIAYPTDDVLCAFNKQVSLLFDNIYNNQQQIQTLIQQRDDLLPKLMSGEVKI